MPRQSNKQACRFFLQTGTCKYGADCRFNHPSRSPKAASNTASSSSSTAANTSASSSSGFQISYLRNYTDPSRAWSLAQKPVEMVFFLQDAFNELQDDVSLVANSLGSLDRSGMDRIREICAAPLIADPLTQQSGRNTTSFVDVILPLLRVLSQQRFSSSLTHLTNPVIVTAVQNLDFAAIHECLVSMEQRGQLPRSLVQLRPEKASLVWKPTSLADVVLYTSRFMHLIITRFANLAQDHAGQIENIFTALKHLVVSTESDKNSSSLSSNARITNENSREWMRDAHEAQQAFFLLSREMEYSRKLKAQRQQRKEDLDAAREGSFIRKALFGLKSAFGSAQQGPGEHREGGEPRHDNDHADIADIDIVPTQQEVLCATPPYLPRNIPGTVVHLPFGAPAHRDLHFRLLRHDVIAPLVSSVKLLLTEESGGKLTGGAGASGKRVKLSGGDSALWVYTNAQIKQLAMNTYQGVYFTVEFDDFLKNKKKAEKVSFWERSRRLNSGTLVCLAAEVEGSPRLFLGTICERDAANLAADRPSIGISLPQRKSAETNAYGQLTRMMKSGAKMTLIQSSGSFFAYSPFLKALQTMTELPLAEYLISPIQENDSKCLRPSLIKKKEIGPPLYLKEQGAMTLSSLFLDPAKAAEVGSEAIFKLGENFPSHLLAQHTTLDASQLRALENGLTQAVSLIQGPPGTGKTFLALEIMRVLLANRKRGDPPILVMCLTNHALDQFLEGVLAQGEKGIVRIGGRSASEKLKEYNLREISKTSPVKGGHGKLIYECIQKANRMDEKIKYLTEQLNELKKKFPSYKTLADVIATTAPALHSAFEAATAVESVVADDEGFRYQGRPQNRESIWKRWVDGKGPAGLAENVSRRAMIASQKKKKSGKQSRQEGGKFAALEGLGDDENDDVQMLMRGIGNRRENIMDANDDLPSTSNSSAKSAATAAAAVGAAPPNNFLITLLEWPHLWSFTKNQRHILLDHWSSFLENEIVGRIERTAAEFMQVKAELSGARDAGDLMVLRHAAVVGMTTTGVASAQTLVGGLSPKIVVVEEAAEVLEAHILCGLAPSTQQLILIGDHLQLRPKVQTFDLSMDSKRNINLDLSLFERLVRQQDFPLATLEEQHRMRPEISNLIRAPVYPTLRDHPKTLEYTHIKGMQHDVFWISHEHPEAGEEEGSSKSNLWEAQFAARLAQYLVQQGLPQGGVTILTGYVGQLLLLRQQLATKFCICVGERDMAEIAEVDEAAAEELAAAAVDENEGARMSVKEAVRLATVDNFQGEESDVIILSLVRSNRERNIGFMKAKNRSNVALSRAKRGLYIIGDATCIRESKAAIETELWPSVIDQLESRDLIGPALPLVCQNHPEKVTLIRNAGDFDTFASDGGCSLRCTSRLLCGHACPRLCHPDDRNHKHVRCPAPCPRLHPACGHACPLTCGEECSPCRVNIREVVLPCGHTARNIPCHRAADPSKIRCVKTVEAVMPFCKHKVTLLCSEVENVEAWDCPHPCPATLSCSHTCPKTCGGCIAETLRTTLNLQKSDKIPKGAALPALDSLQHGLCTVTCPRRLFCGHACTARCHGDSPCAPCLLKCSVRCEHSKCTQTCWKMCAPCAEPCGWQCKHQGACLLPCGAPCLRLPCNERCCSKLACGHRCPSICGEICPSRAFCPECGSSKKMVWDAIMNEERPVTDFTQAELDEDPLIVLPCGHALLVSTADRWMELEYSERSLPTEIGTESGVELRGGYIKDENGEWKCPAPLSARQQAVPGCMMCREPITGLRRYGRFINKGILDGVQHKYQLAMQVALGEIESSLVLLGNKCAACPDTTSMPALNKIAKMGNALLEKALSLRDEAKYSPEVKVYEASRACIARGVLSGEVDEAGTDAIVAALVTPSPDHTPLIRSNLTAACAALEYIKVTKLEIECIMRDIRKQRKKASSGSRIAPGVEQTVDNLHGISELRADANAAVKDFQNLMSIAKSCLGKADTLATTHKSTLYQIYGLRTSAQLLVISCSMLDAVSNPLSIFPLLDERAKNWVLSLKEKRGTLLKELQQLCDDGDVLLDASPQLFSTVAAQKDRDALRAAFERSRESGKRLESEGTVSDEELRLVYSALARTPQGVTRWYQCSNGHLYGIGDCGGPNEGSLCPQCGERIGGWGSQLAQGSTAAVAMMAAVGRAS